MSKPPERHENHVDVDTPDLFPDECLIHEDCDQVTSWKLFNFQIWRVSIDWECRVKFFISDSHKIFSIIHSLLGKG